MRMTTKKLRIRMVERLIEEAGDDRRFDGFMSTDGLEALDGILL